MRQVGSLFKTVLSVTGGTILVYLGIKRGSEVVRAVRQSVRLTDGEAEAAAELGLEAATLSTIAWFLSSRRRKSVAA